jgi:serine/threonine protein kinase
MTIVEFDQLQHAFEKATSKNGPDREDNIRQVSIRDPGLANDVSTLLAFETGGVDPLERTCDNGRRTCVAVSVDSTIPTIQGYAVKRRIGSGGQADVFLACQESTGQDVAIKVFRGSGLADSQRHRIDAETKALVRLQLPNVVAILDRGQTACGREFLVTRFVAGLPIDVAAAGLLPGNPQRVADLFAKVAETLARVHRYGIIHRDLKPANILVDHNGEPYVLDFGLASFFADPSGRLLTVTPDDAFQGSILWASPEQVDASFGAVDQRSDIYSLGVVLYQALTGRFPYPVEGGILAVAQQIVRTAPTPMETSQRAQLLLHASEFQAVVFRALDKQPERRFQSADELAASLRKVQHAAPMEDHVAGSGSRRYSPYRLAVVCVAAMAFAAIWPGLNMSFFAEPKASKSPLADGIDTANADAAQESLRQSFDEELAPFGVVPPQWTEVGALKTQHHEIERGNIEIDGDFVLAIQASVDRAARASFTLTLVGTGGDRDLRISAEKVTTWSDNESWGFRTPAGTILKGLPVGSHTFVLKRQGELMTLAADAIHRPDLSRTVLATFVASGRNPVRAIRLATTGPAIQLARLRLHTGAGNSQ